jgi:hypothetical protein
MSSIRLYPYVGPPAIAARAGNAPSGFPIASPADLLRWLREAGQTPPRVVATFVIDSSGRLLLADRHSEHVACAGGQAVQAAGEMTLLIRRGSVEVEAVSNQSLGYCPEPESWRAVARALAEAGLPAPSGYEPTLQFRRCAGCSGVNVVKDGVFECGVCGSPLPEAWNLG